MGDTMKRVPFEKPPFSLSKIKKAIPPHCSPFIFMSHYIATSYFHNIPHPLSFLSLPIYWAVQGFTLAGLAWVVCVYGVPLLALPHYDSSEWDWLRGALATVDRDYGILNKVETIKAELERLTEENNTLRMMLEVLSSKYTKLETHLQEINKTQHKGMSSNQIGLHCRTTNSSEWDWLRGALVTVDRDYGILNKVFHNITDTHVVHHLFSTMPHYHAMVATKAIKLILGEYYLLKECIYVELDTENRGVFSYIGKF
ncbi:hypothetical protein JHK86_007486 [Glycine max]|nr:hypothetical protein JHK86_007486 [Glycine max]